jgi:Fanconi anemia group M protein
MINDETKIKIIVDTREMRSKIVKKLFELGVKIENQMLDVGDFVLSESVCVERKTVSDFLQSIIDGRIFQQLEQLSTHYEKPVIILEGHKDIYAERMMHPNAIRGALASIAIDFRVPIIKSESEEETALFLYTIASREQIDKKTDVRIRGERKPQTDSFMQEYLVTGLPGVGRGIAQNLLRHFRTVEKVFTATEKELKEVEKVGKEKAKRIRNIVTKGYEE